MSATYLGLDLGTSGLKAVLLDEAETVLADATAPLEVSRPAPGWSEQDPAHWIAAAERAVGEIAASHPAALAAVAGIGLSGQQHGATLLGADDRPLRPCILWNDGRSEAECAVLDAAADYRGIGGNLVMAGFTAPKLEWVRAHEPEIFAATRAVLLPKDYLRLWLTGEKVSEMSDSSGTLWLDIAARDWSEPLLEASRLDLSHMPRLVEGSEVSGRLRPELAARWGMAAAPVVAGGGGDNAASACGVGALAPDSGFLSLGTSGVLFVTNESFRPNTAGAVHAMCHAAPGLWHQMTVHLSAADSLSWLGRIVGREPAALTQALGEDAAPDPAGPAFHPYLSGERTPIADAGARGAFAGLSQSTSVEDLTRAVLNGVALAFADGADALRTAGTNVVEAQAVGGGARSALWMQIIADATGIAFATPVNSEVGAALGAARLGACAATGADPVAHCRPGPASRVFEPNPAHRAAWDEMLTRHRARYAAEKSIRA